MVLPKLWEENRSSAQANVESFVLEFIQKIQWVTGGRILDFGCGTGSLCSKYFLPKAIETESKIIGVDISESMIEFAKKPKIFKEIFKYLWKKHFSSENIVEYVVGDLMSENWKESGEGGLVVPFGQKYNVIFAIHVMHYISDYGLALERLYELLNPEGYFCATIVSGVFIDIMKKMRDDSIWSKYMKDLKVPDWAETDHSHREFVGKYFEGPMKAAGFKTFEVKNNMTQMPYKGGYEAFAKVLISVNPFTKLIPESELEELLKFYLDQLKEMEEITYDSINDQIIVEYNLVTIFAQK